MSEKEEEETPSFEDIVNSVISNMDGNSHSASENSAEEDSGSLLSSGSGNSGSASAWTEEGSVSPSSTTSNAFAPTSSEDHGSSAFIGGNGSSASAEKQKHDEGKQGLSVGSIVAITVGAVAIVLMIAAFVIWYKRLSRLRHHSSILESPPNKKHKRRQHSSVNTPHTENITSGNFTGPTGFSSSRSHQSALNSSSIPSGTGGLWEDEAITAVRVPLEKVIRTSLISRGGYGEVYRGTYKDQIVAIKMLLPATRKEIRHINAFLSEIKMMATMEHDHIVQFIGVAWDSLSDLCAVTEFMEGGDLRTMLTRFEAEERRPHGFDHDKIKIAFHVAHALTYLHSLIPVVLHRDLKSKNILLTPNLDAKLTDFGVSRESNDHTMTAGVGTSLWMAPEVMMGERYDEKADIFSFGVVLSELDSHLLPYAMSKETNSGRIIPDTALLQMVSLGRLKVELSSNAPQPMVELASECVSLEPEDRPTASTVLYKLQVMLKMYENYTF